MHHQPIGLQRRNEAGGALHFGGKRKGGEGVRKESHGCCYQSKEGEVAGVVQYQMKRGETPGKEEQRFIEVAEWKMAGRHPTDQEKKGEGGIGDPHPNETDGLALLALRGKQPTCLRPLKQE